MEWLSSIVPTAPDNPKNHYRLVNLSAGLTSHTHHLPIFIKQDSHCSRLNFSQATALRPRPNNSLGAVCRYVHTKRLAKIRYRLVICCNSRLHGVNCRHLKLRPRSGTCDQENRHRQNYCFSHFYFSILIRKTNFCKRTANDLGKIVKGDHLL